MLRINVKKQQGAFSVDASFQVQSAGVTALFGPSGAGKTSIINMVAGLSRPDEGSIIVNGRAVFDSEKKIDLPPEKRGFGCVFQDGRIFPHLSVRSNLTYGMKLIPRNKRAIGFDLVVELLGIEHLLQRRVKNLSGGEKQRVAIGRALLTSPSLLLMDEPLASLDSARKAEVLPFVERLPKQLSIPILYVSHSIDEILNLADTLVLLNSGRVQSMGPVEEIVNQREIPVIGDRNENGSVLATVVDRHDPGEGLTYLKLGRDFLKVPVFAAEPGTHVRVRIGSRNVVLALTRPSDTSVQNILPATVEEIDEFDGSMINVRLNAGSPMTARITRKARADLKLKKGQQVFVMIKSVAISRGSADVRGR